MKICKPLFLLSFVCVISYFSLFSTAYSTVISPGYSEEECPITEDQYIRITPTFYFGFFGGLGQLETVKPNVDSRKSRTDEAVTLRDGTFIPAGSTISKVDFNDPSYVFGLNFGWRYTNFRAEFEAFYHYVDVRAIFFFPPPPPPPPGAVPTRRGVHGSYRAYGGFFNAFYDFSKFREEINVAPYIGGGVGFIRIDDKSELSNAHQTPSNAFAYQLIAGLNFFYSDETRVFLDYRYLTTDKTNAIYGKRYNLQSIQLGINILTDNTWNIFGIGC